MTQTAPVLLAASILAADLGRLNAEIKDAAASGADWIHVDVMDGSFVPPITFGSNAVKAARAACSLPLDVHLMVEHPETQFETFRNAGATRLTIHQETCPHLHRSLSAIRELGMKSGACINPSTPASLLFPVLEACDLVLVMTVNPGWGGQTFIPACLDKVAEIRKEINRRGLTTHVQVDGGIQAVTARECIAAGADVLVAGTAVFGSADRSAAIKSLRS